MDRCPVELWSYIFSLACTDGGRTGAALALTSRWTHHLSSPYRLQSIHAAHAEQIVSLASMLEKTHFSQRRVRFLTISNAPVTHFSSANGAIRQTLHNAGGGATTQCSSQHQAFMIAQSLIRILETVADTLRVLDMDFSTSDSLQSFPYTLVPTDLPALVELRIKGTRSTPILPAPIRPLPSLKRLDVHLTKCYRWGIEDWSLIEELPSIAPELELLYATGLVWCGDLPEYLRRTIYSQEMRSSDTCAGSLFRRLKVVVVPEPPMNVILGEIAVRERYERVMGELEAMAHRDEEGRLVVMSAGSG